MEHATQNRGAGVLLDRPRLRTRVEGALQSGPLLITAGPGFGKTTLMDRVCRDLGHPAAWVSCTDADRDPGRFLLGLVGAIGRAVPGAANAFAERLATAPARIEPESAAEELLADLATLLVEPLLVVIDDAEHLESAGGSLTLITRLLRAETPVMRVVVASRRPLELRVAKLRASGRLTEIGAAELAFSGEESAELLGRMRGGEPDDSEAEALMSAARGWPLAVALLAALPSAHPRERGFDPLDASRATLHSYLLEEALDSFEPGIRDAVIESSISSTVTPGVIEALALPEDLLDRIERDGILVQRLGSDAEFSYHPLFREFLLTRLEAERDDRQRRALHARVAPAIAAAGDPVEAIDHWLSAESWDRLAPFLEQEGPGLVRASPGLIRQWLGRLPPHVRDQPGIRLLEGQLEWSAGNHGRAAELLWDAVPALHGRADPVREWMARFMIADSLASLGDVDGAVRAAEGFDDGAASAAGPFVPATAVQAAMALASSGRFAESERIAERARRHPDADAVASVEGMRRAFIDSLETGLEATLGQIRAYEDSLGEDPFNLRLYLMSSRAVVLDAEGEIDRAIALWTEIEELAGEKLAPYVARENHDWRAKLHAQAGRLAEAEAELARASPVERGWRGYAHHVARAYIAALRGDSAETAAAADRAVEIQRSAPILFRTLAASDLVFPLAGTGNRQRAEALLAETIEVVEQTLPGGGHVPRPGLLMLRACLRAGEGDRDGADEDLIGAWRDAGPERPSIVRRTWPQVQSLLWSALDRRLLDAGAVVDAVADAFPGGAQVVELTEHPLPEVRRAAMGPAIASGHPGAFRGLGQLAEDPIPEVSAAARSALRGLPESAPPLHFRLLGDFSVRRGAWRAREEDWDRPMAARLVRFLLIRRGEVVPSDAIVEALWPKLSPERARSSLHVAVSRARHALDLPNLPGTVLESTEGGYRLKLDDRDSVDAEEFEAAARLALGETGRDQQRLLDHARSLWGGEPLSAERYSDWAVPWRERLIDRYLEVLNLLLNLYSGRGDHPSAIGAARELVELDPLDEGGHRELMAAYARAGRTGQALRQYLECRRALIDGLGTEPAEATSRLQARILAGEPV